MAAIFGLLTPWVLLADGMLQGVAFAPEVKGRNTGNVIELFEWNAYLVNDGGTVNGKSHRIGHLPGKGLGHYEFTMPGSTYSMMVDQPLFWGRPFVISDIFLPNTGTTNLNVEMPTDYSVGFGAKSGIWGNNPWTSFQSPWYQTFLATGTSVTGVSFKLAGTGATDMIITFHEDNGGAVNTWPQVGGSRVRKNLVPLADQWVRYRSGEVPIVPGKRYALRLLGSNGNPDNKFSIFRRMDNGTGYSEGAAYNSLGDIENFDLYAVVCSDNDGTIVPYVSRVGESGALAGWSHRWSQEIRAMGTGLAGANFFFAGGDDWDKEVTFRIFKNGPDGGGGVQVGPQKIGRGAFQSGTNGFVAATWNPGEVPLTPGEQYWIDMRTNPGFNAAKFTQPENVYPFGDAYQEATRQAGVDLHMQVVEYASVEPPTISHAPTVINKNVVRGQDAPNDVLQLTNSGGGLMDYVISESALWLSVSSTSGTVGGNTELIDIVYGTSNLPLGAHQTNITVVATSATNSPQIIPVTITVTLPPFAPADFDQDGDVDQNDYGRFQRCLTGAGEAQTLPACLPMRLDQDEDVDINDFGIFQGCFSGPGNPADVTCAD